ncbi:MAG: hypothetical protein OEU84_02505 [Xanthomonadales bacterium]|nr:hypothetical protein [Xanthomonadales bacterium]
MFRNILTTASIVTITLFLLAACAEQDKATETKAKNVQTADASAAKPAVKEMHDGQGSVMNQPVDFSSQEEVNKSIERVRQQAGNTEADELNKALGVILTQDMSLRQDKDRLFRKLNGKTPNEIIAMMKF